MPGPRYVLQTARLGLRRYVLDDLAALAPVFADPYAARFYPAMGEPAALERWIRWNLANYEAHGHGLWALERLDDGTFLGDAGITWQTVEGERLLEVGWHVHPAHRAMGYATEAGLACLAFGFERLQAAAIGSIVDPANVASLKVAGRVHASRREYAGRDGPMFFYSTNAGEQRRRTQAAGGG